MRKIFTLLYKIAEALQVVCIWLAFLCVAVWCYRFMNLAYDGGGFFSVIEIIPNIVRGLIPYNVDFAGRQIDVSYFPAAVILVLSHLALKHGIMESLDKIIQECVNKEFQAKEKEEALLNEELEEELKNKTLSYGCFVGLLDLHLEYMADENLTKDRKEINNTKQENNKYILYNLYQKYKIKGALKGDKIVLICNDFKMFDTLLIEMISEIKHIYKTNKANGIQTSFTLSYEATENTINNRLAIKILEKISSFRYYNKIIVTTLFASRYGYQNNQKFELRTMGISRFFEKMTNENGEISFKTEDFDLYSLRLKD